MLFVISLVCANICAFGQMADNLIWFDAPLTETKIYSNLGGKVKVQYGAKTIELDTKKGKRYLLKLVEKDFITTSSMAWKN